MPYESYFNRYPVTASLIIFLSLIFLLQWFAPQFLSDYHLYFYFFPHHLNIGTFLGFWSHANFMHLLSNLLSLFILGGFLEPQIRRIEYCFILLSLWIGLMVAGYFLFPGPVVGFSGIALGLLVFSLGVFWEKSAELKQMLLIFLLLNLGVGFFPSVSFWGHFLGALVGLLVFILYKNFVQK